MSSCYYMRDVCWMMNHASLTSSSSLMLYPLTTNDPLLYTAGLVDFHCAIWQGKTLPYNKISNVGRKCSPITVSRGSVQIFLLNCNENVTIMRMFAATIKWPSVEGDGNVGGACGWYSGRINWIGRMNHVGNKRFGQKYLPQVENNSYYLERPSPTFLQWLNKASARPLRQP